ncbi:hypothetical protein QCN27_19825 [Cereibacter sp. SYSU M97828]|nr:hypothetical protein [Cereibacter flavus]
MPKARLCQGASNTSLPFERGTAISPVMDEIGFALHRVQLPAQRGFMRARQIGIGAMCGIDLLPAIKGPVPGEAGDARAAAQRLRAWSPRSSLNRKGGAKLLEQDSWKEHFLEQLAFEDDATVFFQTAKFRVIGLPFFSTERDGNKAFRDGMAELLAVG